MRFGFGANLNQIETRFLGAAERIFDRHNTNVLAFTIDQTHFRLADGFVDAGRILWLFTTRWRFSANGTTPSSLLGL